MRDKVKLEQKIKKFSGSQNCQVELIIFTDSNRKASKSGGQTESGSVNNSTNTIDFQK